LSLSVGRWDSCSSFSPPVSVIARCSRRPSGRR
jgi:hypothetical protein